MKKLKYFLLILLILPIFGLFSGCQEVEIDGNIYTATPTSSFKFNWFSGKITGYIGLYKDIILPESIVGSKVRAIGEYAFANNDRIKSVMISKNVTKIEPFAFANSSIETIYLPDTITEIGEGAFYNCKNLKTIVLPENLKIVDNSLFSQCENLTNVVLPSKATTIGANVFDNCKSLTSIHIPQNVNTINTPLFSGCDSLQSIEVDAHNSNFASTNDNKMLLDKRNYVILALPGAQIPAGIEGIKSSAFYNISDEQIIIIPSSVNAIESNAFYNCNNFIYYFESDTMPAGVDRDWNTNYNAIVIFGYTNPNNNLNFVLNDDQSGYIVSKSDAVTVNSKIVIPYSYQGKPVVAIADNGFEGLTNLQTIVIPHTITSIGDYAFKNSNITSLSLTKNVTDIGVGITNGCKNLTDINISNNYYSSQDGLLYDISNKAIIASTNKKIINLEKFYGDVNKIAKHAFVGLDTIGITIPTEITSIDAEAFVNCNNLYIYCLTNSKPAGWDIDWNLNNRPVEWGYSYTESLGFKEDDNGYIVVGNSNPNATSISIPYEYMSKPVIGIGENAFENYSNLQEIVMRPTITSIGSFAFKNSGLVTLNISQHIQNIGTGISYGCNSLTSINVDDDNTTYSDKNGNIIVNNNSEIVAGCKNSALTDETIIGSYAFAGISSIDNFTIPSSITTIKNNAFEGLSSLHNILIPITVNFMGDNVFKGCSILNIYCEAISKPNGWSKIWNPDPCPEIWNYNNLEENLNFQLNASETGYIVSKNEGLSSPGIIIPYEHKGLPVLAIADNGFEGLTNLQSIIIPNSITSIGDYAFKNTQLTSLVIPQSVTSIGVGITDGCNSLSLIEVNNNNEVFKDNDKNLIVNKNTDYVVAGCATSVLTYEKGVNSYAFSNLSNLNKLTIPSSVLYIQTNAFNNLSNFNNLIIPSSVTTIQTEAFVDCDNLYLYCETDTKPDNWSNTWNNDNRPVMWGYRDITQQGLNYTLNSDGTGYQVSTNNKKLSKIVIPFEYNNLPVLEIASRGFSGMSNIQSIMIPFSITKIGDNAFSNSSLNSLWLMMLILTIWIMMQIISQQKITMK